MKLANLTKKQYDPNLHKLLEPMVYLKPINIINGYRHNKTPYYDTSKFLSKLLNTLTENEYVVQDSFFAAKKIREIPKEIFEDRYRFVSFELESLFTSIPLSRTMKHHIR